MLGMSDQDNGNNNGEKADGQNTKHPPPQFLRKANRTSKANAKKRSSLRLLSNPGFLNALAEDGEGASNPFMLPRLNTTTTNARKGVKIKLSNIKSIENIHQRRSVKDATLGERCGHTKEATLGEREAERNSTYDSKKKSSARKEKRSPNMMQRSPVKLTETVERRSPRVKVRPKKPLWNHSLSTVVKSSVGNVRLPIRVFCFKLVCILLFQRRRWI